MYEVLKDPMMTPAFKTRILRDQVYNKQFPLFGHGRPLDKESLNKLGENVFSCSLCGRCQFSCPFNVSNTPLFYKLRGVYQSEGILPGLLPMVDEAIVGDHNPYGGSQEDRKRWLSEQKPPIASPEGKADVVYFVGCASSYVDKGQNSAKATVKLLDRLGLNWAVLGEEWCCGKALRQVGDFKQATEFAKHNVEEIEKVGAKLVVTSCPACRVVLSFEYPKLLGKPNSFKVVHTTQLLQKALKEGKLKVNRKIAEKVTYHDPCNMARFGGLVEEPREVLRAMSDAFVEMDSHGIDSRCCGGGGMMQATNEDLQRKLTSARVQEAKATGAAILSTTCPTCVKYLSEEANGIRVADLTELLVESISDE